MSVNVQGLCVFDCAKLVHMASDELRRLIEALQDRGIRSTEDDVGRAFAHSETRDKAETWVREYLQPSTLLTKDESEW